MLTTLEKAVAWAQTKSMWPDTFGLACCAIEMMSIVSSRYDIARFGMEAFRSSPRQADLLIVSGRVVAQDGRAAAADLRPDARAEVGDRDGRVRELRRDVQQLRDPPVRRQDRRRRHLRARLPAAARGAHGGDHPAAREGRGRRAARVRDPRASPSDATRASRGSSRRKEEHGETTLVVDRRGSSRPASTCATRSASTSSPTSPPPTTSAGARSGVSGYIGNAVGPRPQRARMTQGYQLMPEPKPKRFAVNYHLLRVAPGGRARACACRSGSTTARPCRASSRSGRPPTGTSARPGT